MSTTFDYVLAADIMADRWSREDSQRALAEGWDLFVNDSSENGPVQLQTLVEPDLLPEVPFDEARWDDDEGAWEHVYFSAAAGSEFHYKALQIIEHANPMEHEAIEAHIGKLGQPA